MVWVNAFLRIAINLRATVFWYMFISQGVQFPFIFVFETIWLQFLFSDAEKNCHLSVSNAHHFWEFLIVLTLLTFLEPLFYLLSGWALLLLFRHLNWGRDTWAGVSACGAHWLAVFFFDYHLVILVKIVDCAVKDWLWVQLSCYCVHHFYNLVLLMLFSSFNALLVNYNFWIKYHYIFLVTRSFYTVRTFIYSLFPVAL